MQDSVWAVALAFVAWAGWRDWRSRCIPNWLTLSGFALGLGLNSVAEGWAGTKLALGGAGVALGLLLPLVLLRGLGAGDWKLMGALGAFLGARQVLLVLLGATLIVGIMAVAQTTLRRRWGPVLGNMWELIHGFGIFGLRPHPVVTLDNPRLLSLPFGVGVALATWGYYWLGPAWGNF